MTRRIPLHVYHRRLGTPAHRGNSFRAIRKALAHGYTGHDHRLGLKTTGVAADIDLIANAPADLAALLGDAEKLNEVREFHRNWGDQDTDTLDGLDLWEQLGRLLGVTP